MPEYRRVKFKGATYFFTLVTYQRQRIFSSPEPISLLTECFDRIKTYHPFKIDAYCILPDHIHFIWSLPENDNNYSMRISQIKRRFTNEYSKRFEISNEKNESRKKRKESIIWQRRFWEHWIRDENDLNHHIDYVHYNPVKHGLVSRAQDWKNSSFHEFVEMGYYDRDWGENYKNDQEKYQFGE
jgi:putative transposase